MGGFLKIIGNYSFRGTGTATTTDKTGEDSLQFSNFCQSCFSSSSLFYPRFSSRTLCTGVFNLHFGHLLGNIEGKRHFALQYIHTLTPQSCLAWSPATSSTYRGRPPTWGSPSMSRIISGERHRILKMIFKGGLVDNNVFVFVEILMELLQN